MQLPTVQSCDNCGACCLEQLAPPGYLQLLDFSLFGLSIKFDEDDAERFSRLPQDALNELLRYVYRQLMNLPADNAACVWLDQTTNGCRYYEHRPTICREFKMGCQDCLDTRSYFKVT